MPTYYASVNTAISPTWYCSLQLVQSLRDSIMEPSNLGRLIPALILLHYIALEGLLFCVN